MSCNTSYRTIPAIQSLPHVDFSAVSSNIIFMNTKELEFTVFCIESVAELLGLKGEESYRLLTEQSDILDSYIIPCYDTLHTQGKEYIVNDIVDYLREKGLLL